MEKWSLEKLQNGHIFLIDKPLDWTSFDVVKKLKYTILNHFGIKKIKVGHAGTLDPKATGLLVVCVGKATKQISNIQDAEKLYTGTIKLGATTPSYDTETEEENHKSLENLEAEHIYQLEDEIKGVILQAPPIFSAIKKEGKRAYDLARKGEDFDLPARPIRIDYLKITRIEFPFVDFEVQCSKGTYIRSLAHDIGEKLKVGGYLWSLRREKIGDYDVKDSEKDILLSKDFFN